jgi:hypothetical protein
MKLSIINLRDVDFAIEEATAVIDSYNGKKIKALIDPKPQDVLSILDKSVITLGGLLEDGEVCIWDRDMAEHASVAGQLGFSKDAIGFYLRPEYERHDGRKIVVGISATVSEFSGRGGTNTLMNSQFIASLMRLIEKRNENLAPQDDMSDILSSLSGSDY